MTVRHQIDTPGSADRDSLFTARRQFLIGGTLAATALAIGPPALAKSDKVFLDYTQKQLDDAYNQRVWAKNVPASIRKYGSTSAATRKKYKFETRSYGKGPAEKLEIFPPTKAAGTGGAPIHIFIHGGAWRAGSAKFYSFPAPTFVDNGAIYIALDFANLPKVRLPDMAHQVRSAIAWVYKNAKSFGGDPERIFVSGHSSGGHLCGVALVTDWSRYGVPATVIKGGLPVSGMYDMKPVMLSSRSSYVKITKAEEHALSAIRHLERIVCPVIVAYGDGESPEFKRQSREFAAALKKVGKPVELVEVKGVNHFEVIQTLDSPDGAIGRLALKQMGLA